MPMEIYHGSNIVVKEPIAYAGRRNLDFGKGSIKVKEITKEEFDNFGKLYESQVAYFSFHLNVQAQLEFCYKCS